MKVRLAGYNIDADVINQIKKQTDFSNDQYFTPEILSASYARISRDPRSIKNIRASARKEVKKARKSNENIIFKLGHSSIAEHAVFNIDIEEVSRYLTEHIEKFRLVSYTEKSQRYITLNRDYIIPEEFDEKAREDYLSLINKSFEYYRKVLPEFIDRIKHKYPDLTEEKTIESLSRQDARYLLLMGMTSQLGMTINARNLENMISYLASLEIKEAEELSNKIFRKIDGLAPSVIKYYKPRENLKNINKDLAEYFSQTKILDREQLQNSTDVELINYDTDFEDKLFAYILVNYNNVTFNKALQMVKQNFTLQNKKEILQIYFKNMKFFDNLPRIFEMIDFTFSIYCSSSCYGQLKRHRMATNIFKDYDPSYSPTMPKLFEETKNTAEFNEITELSSSLYKKYKDKYPVSSVYFLTNAHKRKVIFKSNLREMYHIARLRLDKHAQWDIRHVVSEMVKKIREQSEIVATLLKGKDSFNQILEELE